MEINEQHGKERSFQEYWNENENENQIFKFKSNENGLNRGEIWNLPEI